MNFCLCRSLGSFFSLPTRVSFGVLFDNDTQGPVRPTTFASSGPDCNAYRRVHLRVSPRQLIPSTPVFRIDDGETLVGPTEPLLSPAFDHLHFRPHRAHPFRLPSSFPGASDRSSPTIPSLLLPRLSTRVGSALCPTLELPSRLRALDPFASIPVMSRGLACL